MARTGPDAEPHALRRRDRRTARGLLIARIREASRPGAGVGALFGVVDGLLAGLELAGRWEYGLLDALLATSTAVVLYALLYGLAAAILAALGLGRARVVGLLLGLGLFLELYWRSRPFVFAGYPALSPQRVGTSCVLAAIAWCCAASWARRRWEPGRGLRVAASVVVGLTAATGTAAWVLDRTGDEGRGRIHAGNRELPNIVLVIVDAQITSSPTAPLGCALRTSRGSRRAACSSNAHRLRRP